MPVNDPPEEIFRMEYHPVGEAPRRTRFIVQEGSTHIERVSERLEDGEWQQVKLVTIDYFEYSDG